MNNPIPTPSVEPAEEPALEPPVHDSLGSLSAQYESGQRESGAVGYDRRGGTSYGKYQISSPTMPSFLEFLEREKPEFFQELSGHPILPVDQDGRKRELANAWRQLASTQGEELEKLEHAFIKETHFDKAFNHIESDELKTRIISSETLQDVLWSTAVQHGPYDPKGIDGAANIFDNVFSEGITDEKFIADLYKERGNHFSKSRADIKEGVLNRFKEESAQALEMLKTEKAFNSIESDELKESIKFSKTLKYVLGNTASQHGPDGAASIFNKAFSKGITNEKFITNVYKEREERISKSEELTAKEKEDALNLLKKESAQALEMLKEEEAEKAKKEEKAEKGTQPQLKGEKGEEHGSKAVPGANTNTAVNSPRAEKAADIVQNADAPTQQSTGPRQQRRAMALAFKQDPAQAARTYPELADAQQALEAVGAVAGQGKSKNRAMAIIQHKLAQQIDQGKPIPTPNQAIRFVKNAINQGLSFGH